MDQHKKRIDGAIEMDNQLSTEKYYEMLWNYFSFHANQRISVMNFYIILESAMIGGYIAVFGSVMQHIRIFEIGIGIAICFFSVVFYFLDVRTKHMIKSSENALIDIEKAQSTKLNIRIFTIENQETEKQRNKHSILKLLSYSKLFVLIYMFFSLMGILGIVYALI